MPRRKKFSDEIRDAIKAAPITRYRIAKEISVGESLLSKFMLKQSGLSMAVLDKLAEAINLHVTIDRKD